MSEFFDAKRLMNRALESESGGIRIKFETEKSLLKFRLRCYSARKRDREQSEKAYDYGHPLHGVSPYDGLYFDKESGDKHTLVIKQISDEDYGVLSVEELKVE